MKTKKESSKADKNDKTEKSEKSKVISTSSEWTIELLERYNKEIETIAKDYQLETYPNQIEIITAEQMIDAYSSVGMPVNYPHWSFGKQFLSVDKNYKRGHMGLAFEIVINSNPCIAYLMEENPLPMQVLVIAHASYGHNSFFKNNYLFKTWTSADSIVDYLVFAKNYITQCEELHGTDALEAVLDACHALSDQGVDRYKRPAALSMQEEKMRQANREEYLQSQINDLWRTIPKAKAVEVQEELENFPEEPQENLLYFFEKNSPLLEPWQREVIRIVRKMSQYFYPQRQTKVMNEGWATFWHYTIVQDLYKKGLIDDRFMMEILHNHTNVIYQPAYDSPYFNGINPYTLGFSMFMDIRRICENPTDEDRKWFPDIAGGPWLETLHTAAQNYKDESFIAQYLSPKVIRDLKLFGVMDDDTQIDMSVSAIHNDEGYQAIRQALSEQYNIANMIPDIQVVSVNRRGDRSLTLRYTANRRRPLGNTTQEVLKHVYTLWGFPVKLETIDDKGEVTLLMECPPKTDKHPLPIKETK